LQPEIIKKINILLILSKDSPLIIDRIVFGKNIYNSGGI